MAKIRVKNPILRATDFSNVCSCQLFPYSVLSLCKISEQSAEWTKNNVRKVLGMGCNVPF